MMKHILVIAKAYPPIAGGVETYSEAIVRSYLKHGYEVTLLTQTTGARGWGHIEYDEGVVKYYNTGSGKQYKVCAALVYQLMFNINLANYRFCHITTWRPAIALLPWFKHIKVVLTIHGREVMNYPPLIGFVMKYILRRANSVISVSEQTRNIAVDALKGGIPEGNWDYSFNGISYPDCALGFDTTSRQRSDPVKILSFARHVPRKNIQGCIKALSYLHEHENIRFQYTIAGHGPMTEDLKRQVKNSGLDYCVKFLGYIEEREIPKLYMDHEIFLHPQINAGEGNDFEGFGLVIADAMSFGCAVVAGEAGGPKDFIAHNENGLLVDGSNEEEMIGSIRSIISDAELRCRISQGAQKYACENLRWENHTSKILNSISGNYN